MMKIEEFAKAIDSQDDILIITHLRPDGDTLGSACALCSALRSLGKRAYIFRNIEITSNYIEYTKPYIAPDGYEHAFVIAVDVASEELFARGYTGRVDICIDHHPSNTMFAGDTILRPEKASCGEIIFDLIREVRGGVDEREANLLYLAVSTDTGCFCYANTTSDTLRTAAALIDAGADNKGINKKIFRTVRKSRLLLEGLIYTGLKHFRGGKITVVTVTLDMMARSGATEDDCEDLASLAGKVEGSRVGITIRETEKGKCKVSVRTAPEVDADAICAIYGGGGHAMAAGCTLECTPDEAAQKIMEAVDKVWPV